MKKIAILLALLIVLPQIQLFAQSPDTLDVPFEDSQGRVGAISRFILGDTTASGERNNINRVYRLQRGEIYLVNGKTYFDFPLTLIADDDESKQPPVIAPFPLEDGSIPRVTFYLYEDSYLKNIYFLGMAPNNERSPWDRPLILGGDGTKLVLENCICDAYTAAGIANIGENTSLFVKDCLWRNICDVGQFDGQFFFNYGGYMDTISVVNCTFFNGSSYFLCNAREYANYVRFEHNTLFINNINPFYTPYLSNADIRNNIFFSPASAGETEEERLDGWYDWDGERMAVFSIDTIPSDMAANHGISESERRINLTNNAYFWPQKIKDYLANNDSVSAPVWMNDRTTAMFNDDANYPNLVAENNVEADPGFNSDIMNQVDSLLVFIRALREGGTTHPYFYNPSGAPIFPGRWPIPEDLSYTNTELLTASTEGLPLGDLNWFPDKKAIWEAMQTSVSLKEKDAVPQDFALEQNYPNPFNPETQISFRLNKSGHVKLAVYNMLGQKVKTLLDKEKQAGRYRVTWDGTDENGEKLSSGIYYYRLEMGESHATRKMLLLK